MLTADVTVVGAGPAGAAAAITAADAGLRVLLVDRASFPRDKCCGDGLTTGALRRLELLGLDPAGLPSWQPVRRVHIRIPDGRQAALDLPDPTAVFAATVRRVELDAALVRLAAAAGAEVMEGTAAVGARPGPRGGVEVDLDGGDTVRSWYAVAADGMWSPLRKALGRSESAYLGEWHAARQYFARTGPAARDLWVWFEDDLRPGYAWSFPLPDGHANVGFGVRRRSGESTGQLKRRWADVVGRAHVAGVLGPDAEPEGAIKTWPIPARIGASPLTALGGRVLFAGDAARAPDCMTGEGIAQAVETGELAARTVAAWGPHDPQGAGRAYEASLRRGMALDDAVSAALSKVLTSPRGSRAWFDIANSTPRARIHFTRWMFEDYPRAALITPWRWRRGMLSQPGPYGASRA